MSPSLSGPWPRGGVKIRPRNAHHCGPGDPARPHPTRPPLPCWAPSCHPPSFTMPTARHFWKRQNWQRFRRLLSTGQSLFARQMYLALFCTVRWGGNTEQAVRVRGGEGKDGEGTVQILLPTQTKALSVRSYFSNIWVAREGEMEGQGGEKSWRHWGQFLPQEEDPIGPKTRSEGLPGSRHLCFLMCLCPSALSNGQTGEGRGVGGGDGS